MNNKSSDNVGAFFSAYLWLKEDGVNYREENAAILDRAGVPEGRRIYVSGTTPTVIAVFSRKEAEQIRREDRFMSFTPYGFDAPSISAEDVIPQQIGADMIASEYNGTGVKVGVISAEGLRYDPFAKSLEGVKITDLPTLIPSEINSHPTAVISQIAGKRVEADGITFFGIAKEAEIYFASTRTSKGLYEAVEKMMELGMSVINYSAGKLSEEYTDLDRQIDRLIRNGNILFVTASGNRRPMTSPGRAYNGMTVGNAVTKERPNTPLAQPWQVWCQSEDSCSGYNDRGVHKPDLVAPGGWVGYVDRFGNADVNNFGTSFACPWVSAVAASLISSLGAPPSYLTLKAVLLASCNAESLSDTDDPYVAKEIRLRSGYGMLDAEKALRILREATVIEGVLSDGEEYSVTGTPEDSVTVMLVYEKGEDETGATLTVDGESYDVYEQNTLLIKKRSRGEVTLLSVYGKGNYRFSLLAFRTP